MRKILALLIVLMMSISISSLVLADEKGNGKGHQNETHDQNDTDNETQEQDDIEVDNETQREILVMNSTLGAEIRLLQLQKALLKNIFKANMTIEVLKVLGFNITTLEDIIDQMKEVLEEVKVANTSSNESVEIFVELKNQSKNLTKQFRENLSALLDEVTLQELRQRIKENFTEEFPDLSKNIRNKIRNYNKNQLYRLYGFIGDVNDSFIQDYLNGNITLNLTKLQICKVINQLTGEKRYLVFSEIKEDNIKRKIQKDAYIEDMHNHRGRGRHE